MHDSPNGMVVMRMDNVKPVGSSNVRTHSEIATETHGGHLKN